MDKELQFLTIATAQMRYDDRDAIDITAKSTSQAGRILAPTWELVAGHKHFANPNDSRWHNAEALTDKQYSQAYLNLINQRYLADQRPFVYLLTRQRLILKCYCRGGAFCHRRLATGYLMGIAPTHGIHVVYLGEIS